MNLPLGTICCELGNEVSYNSESDSVSEALGHLSIVLPGEKVILIAQYNI